MWALTETRPLPIQPITNESVVFVDCGYAAHFLKVHLRGEKS